MLQAGNKKIRTKNELVAGLRNVNIQEVLVIDRVENSRFAASQCQRFMDDKTDTSLILLKLKQ